MSPYREERGNIRHYVDDAPDSPSGEDQRSLVLSNLLRTTGSLMSLFNELKRRNVIRVAMAYAVASWLIIQVVETILPAFGLGDAAIRFVVILLAVGFIPTLMFSWAFEVTPEGIKREVDVIREHSITHFTAKKLDRIIMLLLALALSYFAIDKFVLDPLRDEYIVEAARMEGRSEALEESRAGNSIAVLPLVDMTPDRDLEYLGDGMAEELIHGLAQVSGIDVVARTSSFYFKNRNLDVQSIGGQLGVKTILEGSIKRKDDQLRVTLQLIDVDDGFHIWSKQYDGYMSEIFKLQDEITQNVVGAVMPELDIDAYSNLTNAGTDNALAYEAYLIGSYERTQQTRESVDRAIEQFRLAISHDPGFMRAYEGLIDAYNFKGFYYGEREEMLALAGEVLEQAREHDPDKSNANWFWMERLIEEGENFAVHFGEAEELYSLMIRDRSHAANNRSVTAGFYHYALLLAKSGLFDAALDFMVPLEAIDPMSINIKLRLAELYTAVQEYAKALRKYEDLLELSPGYVQARLDMFLVYGKLGRLGEAEAIRNELASKFSVDLTELLDAFLLYWGGDKEAAVASVNFLASSPEIPANYKGVAFLAFGEIDKAFFFFQAAADQDDPYVSELILTQARILPEKQWASIKETDEFMSLMSRYGYDDSWPAELAGRANAITGYTQVEVNVNGD